MSNLEKQLILQLNIGQCEWFNANDRKYITEFHGLAQKNPVMDIVDLRESNKKRSINETCRTKQESIKFLKDKKFGEISETNVPSIKRSMTFQSQSVDNFIQDNPLNKTVTYVLRMCK
uniref:Uncharacterized protein n=1 Tax=Rhizophagus irregularis (strain DAOM 181602 / DAOM 197198 / MUCL 43194) TaxID=747089 RepID=U9SJM4_RHIID